MGRNGNPQKITQLRTVRNVFSSLAVSLDNTHKLNNYANIYKLSDIRTILEHNNYQFRNLHALGKLFR